MGQLLHEADFETVFVDANPSLVRSLNTQGSYPLRILDAYSQKATDLAIDRFRALATSQEDEIAEAIAGAHVIATAVGVSNLDAVSSLLAGGIRARCARHAGPLDVYLCENMPGVAGLLAQRVMDLLDGPARIWADGNIGFVGTSVARIVGGAGVYSAQDDPLLVIADAHRDIPYDGPASRAGDPHIEGFHPVSNFKAEIERKIFTHNVGHAALAYLGYLRGHTYIHETFDDDFVRSVFDGALDETTEALLKRYPADLDRREHTEIRQDVRIRFGNPLLKDSITRVAKDPIRKLGRDDRIIGAAELCRSQDIDPDHLATICAAALHYDYPEDTHALHLQAMLQEMGVADTLREVSGIDPSGHFGQKAIEKHRWLETVKARLRE